MAMKRVCYGCRHLRSTRLARSTGTILRCEKFDKELVYVSRYAGGDGPDDPVSIRDDCYEPREEA